MNSFPPQVWFNCGYHDAANAVKRGYSSGGFDEKFHKGRTITPEIVLTEHFDRVYAQGWAAGYKDAKEGRYSGNSAIAWGTFLQTEEGKQYV